MLNTDFPSRGTTPRRDRHGRGLRGPLFPTELPVWKNRASIFDELLAKQLRKYKKHLGEKLEKYDFAVLDVPQNDPSSWEKGVVLSRFLPFDRGTGKKGRIVFYRLPIMQTLHNTPNKEWYLHQLITNQLASVLHTTPEEIDFLQ